MLVSILRSQKKIQLNSKQKEASKDRGKIIEIENRPIEKVNKTKTLFFEKINKIENKPLARVIKKQESINYQHQK